MKRKFFQATPWWPLRGGGLLGLLTTFHSFFSVWKRYKSPYTYVCQGHTAPARSSDREE